MSNCLLLWGDGIRNKSTDGPGQRITRGGGMRYQTERLPNQELKEQREPWGAKQGARLGI